MSSWVIYIVGLTLYTAVDISEDTLSGWSKRVASWVKIVFVCTLLYMVAWPNGIGNVGLGFGPTHRQPELEFPNDK